MPKKPGSLRGTLILVSALLLCGGQATLHASWTVETLPSLPVDFASYRAAQMSDGRVIYGTNNQLSRGSVPGSSFSLQSYTAAGAATAWDPSSISLYSDTLGAIGAGTFGPSSIYLFNPSDLATSFAPIAGLSLQNYAIAFRDANSLFVGGNNGTGGSHSVNYVTTSGSVNKVIIDNISTYSGDFAIDLAGNLYVSDNDDLKLYKFTASQLTAAINGTALGITDGTYLTTLSKNGSLAVDGFGRIWSAGYQSSGLDLFDPITGQTASLLPGLNNSNYVVQSYFSGGESYVGYLNAGGYLAGATLTYGTQKASAVVPEPTSGALLMAAGVAALARRRRR